MSHQSWSSKSCAPQLKPVSKIYPQGYTQNFIKEAQQRIASKLETKTAYSIKEA